MSELPTGTVTFLFTDVEGSTRLLRALGSDRYADVLATHNELLRAEFAVEGGLETHHQGDSFVVVFRSAGAAVRAAIASQRALAGRVWPEGRTCASAWDCTRARRRSAWMATSVLPSIRHRASATPGTAARCWSPRLLRRSSSPICRRTWAAGSRRCPLPDLDRLERLFQLTAAGLAEQFPPLVKRVIETTPAPGPPLLEREAELETLRAIAEDVQLGNGRVVAIEAEPARGKTR